MLPLLTMGGFKINYYSYPFIPSGRAGLSYPPTRLLFICAVALVWVYLVAAHRLAAQAPAPLPALTTCAVATLLFIEKFCGHL